MKNMRRKLLSLLLVMAMVCSMVPSALATGTDVAVTNVTLSKNTLSLTVNGTNKGSETLTATVTPENATNKTVTWTSSNTNVANVSNGIVTAVAAGTSTITAKAGDKEAKCEVTVTDTSKPTLTLSTSNLSVTPGASSTLSATVGGTLPTSGSNYITWVSSNSKVAVSTNTTTISSTGTYSVSVSGSAGKTSTITATLYNAVGTTVTKQAEATCSVTVSNTTTNYLTNLSGNRTLAVNSWDTLTATVSTALTDTLSGYYVEWTTSNTSVVRLSTSDSTSSTVSSDINASRQASVNIYAVGTTGSSATIIATLRKADDSTTSYGSQSCVVSIGTNTGYTLRLRPSSGTSSFGTSVPVNYNYNDSLNWNYNDYYYYGYRTFTVVPVLYDANGREVTSTSYTITSPSYSWSLKGYTLYTSGSSSTLNSYYSTSNSGNSSSSATIYARDIYNYTSSSSANLSCTLSADVTVGGVSLGRLTTSTSPSHHAYWTVYPGTYYNTGSISAAATVYANSTGYSLGSTDDAGSTSIVSELQSAVSSRYGNGYYNSDRYYWDSSRGAWIDRNTGSIVSYDSTWNGYYGNGYYGYDTLRYVTFSSVSATGGSLSASTGTRYYVGGRSSYGSSALENVVFTPNGKASTASFNITAYGDYGTYSGTITFNMSGSATPTTLTMSGTAGQNLNFKTSDFTSWWRGMYPSGNLSYVRFTSCSTGSLTNGVNGSSVVGNNTSCYASASGSQVAIGNLIYNSGSTAAATVTVNFTGYGSTTSSTSASTNRAGTLTITLAAGTPTVVSNLNVSYSCGASGVQLNATTFYNAVSASVSTASYITLGSPSSGSLTQNGVNVTSGSRFVLSGTSNNIGDVLYKPAANFNGTATIPFVAYNSSNQTVATGTISIAVTQATTPTTPSKTFSDITGQYAWAAQYINALAAAGIVGGREDGKFHPEQNVTYGEALKLILLAAGYPEQAQGSGTNWAVNYLTLAINNQILPGSASSYTLSAAVDRNTIAAMTAKALKLSPVTDTSSSPFVDSKDPYVLALNKAGIIFGDSSSGAAYYQGEKPLTRAEVSAIIYRINNYRG